MKGRPLPRFTQYLALLLLPLAALLTACSESDAGASTSVEAVSQTRPLPADKPELAAAHALAGRLIGMGAIYLDAGSGAAEPVAPTIIGAVVTAVI